MNLPKIAKGDRCTLLVDVRYLHLSQERTAKAGIVVVVDRVYSSGSAEVTEYVEDLGTFRFTAARAKLARHEKIK